MRKKHLLLSVLSITFFSSIASLIAIYTGISENFFDVFLILEIRFIVTLFSMLWFFSTVKPYELAIALEKIYIPSKFVWFLTSIYQIIPLVSREARIINGIRKIKGLTAKKFSFKSQYFVAKHTLNPMINSAINRGVDLAQAMIIKGYRGERRNVFVLNLKLKVIDYIIVILSIIILVITIALLGN